MRKAMRRALAAIMAFFLAVTVTPAAQAANRDWLRADSTGHCEWDQAQYWVQYCTVWSPSMEKHIPVHIQPAARGGNAGLYLLDGMRALPDRSAWTTDVNAGEVFADSNITVVMPAGGAGSFYSDWDGPATFDPKNPVKYRWETFLTQELPSYLETNFGVAKNNNSIAGLSMGATAAISLAAKHPGQFKQAISWSGYLTTTQPGMQTLLRLALLDVGGFNILTMYGSTVNPRRFENDPFWNMGGLKNTDVYISSGSGIPGAADAGYPTGQKISGALLEWFSGYSTTIWETKARAQGLHVTADYPKYGLHNWQNWRDQIWRTKPRILDVMNAH